MVEDLPLVASSQRVKKNKQNQKFDQLFYRVVARLLQSPRLSLERILCDLFATSSSTQSLTMDAPDKLRRRHVRIATPTGYVETSGAGSVVIEGAGAIPASGEAEVCWYEAGPVPAGGAVAADPFNVVSSCLNYFGNVPEYVSDEFCAEAVDKMEAAISRIDGLRSKSQIPTIYKVSTELNGNYENDGIKPVIVRLGLLNWSEHDQSKEKLQDYKWYCVQQLINVHSSMLEPASETPMLLRKCLNSMIHVGPEIRQSYLKGYNLIDSNRLALMMLLDGCFILHQLFRSDDNSTEMLYGSPEEWEFVKRDLLLLENQIPFFVLRMLLLDKLEIGQSEHNVVKGSLRLFRSCCSGMLPSNCSESDIDCDQVRHLLHLLYLCVALPPKPSDPGNVSLSMDPQWISCTKELEEAGIRFKKRKNAQSFLDIRFDHGVLEIPPLLLDDFSNALFRNLVAFEKSDPTRQCLNISNYTVFMHDLMKTDDDIQILQRHGILVNMMSSTRDASGFFNGNCTRMFLPSNNYLLPLMENLREYKDRRRHKWGAELMRGYCSSPWGALKVLVKTLMLIAALLQTIYTVYGYYKTQK